jgi:site-specific DNA recombinase
VGGVGTSIFPYRKALSADAQARLTAKSLIFRWIQGYEYFYCLGRHNRRTECDLPHVSVEVVEDSLARYYGTIELGADLRRRIGDVLMTALRTRLSQVDKEAHRQRQRILALEAKRRKLMDAYYVGAVPAELLKEEQDKITKQLADTGAALANIEVSWEIIERNVNMALALAGQFEAAYQQADKATRRQCNQSVIDAAFVDVPGVVYTRLTGAFEDLLAADFLERVEEAMKNRRPSSWDGGSDKDFLVEVAGIEPASSDFSVGLLRAHPPAGSRVLPRCRRRRRTPAD